MEKLKVLLTGATGAMGSEAMKALISHQDVLDLSIIALDNKNERKIGNGYRKLGVTVLYGDLTDASFVKNAIQNVDLIIHMAAFVSPLADENPRLAYKINFGSCKNLVDAIVDNHQTDKIKLVFIGTVAETGDRMPPLEYGRTGDPIMPSVFDYYALSKCMAERYLMDSSLKYWVSLRQTGIIGKKMSLIRDPIIVHNPINNYLEYVSDRDSGTLIANICLNEEKKELNEDNFYRHVFNIGGGKNCIANTYEMYSGVFRSMGIKSMFQYIDPKVFALRNFHGQIYLDSDKLENLFHFRHDSIEYFNECFRQSLGIGLPFVKLLTKIPLFEKLISKISCNFFYKMAKKPRGTYYFIKDNDEDRIDAFYGSKKEYEDIPKDFSNFKLLQKGDPLLINHGYNESLSLSEIGLEEMQKAATYRGGCLLSTEMKKGDMISHLRFSCPFGHEFEASPQTILLGGFFCPTCEKEGWNYDERALRDPFFAQVYHPSKERPAKFYPSQIK